QQLSLCGLAPLRSYAGGTLVAIRRAILTAELPALALHVSLSMMTLFAAASARSQPQPGGAAFFGAWFALSVPFSGFTSPFVHCSSVRLSANWSQTAHCWAEVLKKAVACSAVGNRTTA